MRELKVEGGRWRWEGLPRTVLRLQRALDGGMTLPLGRTVAPRAFPLELTPRVAEPDELCLTEYCGDGEARYEGR